jgi:preprotein translocase subunit SecD
MLLVATLIALGCGHSKRAHGPRLIVQADFSAAKSPVELADLTARVTRAIEGRITNMTGVGEYSVRQIGADKFEVSASGTTLPDLRSAVFENAEVRFYWARNLDTIKKVKRPYREEVATDPKKPEVKFIDNATLEEIPVTAAGSVDINPAYKKIVDEWQLILSADDIERATPTSSDQGWIPAFRFTLTGGRKMKAWCMAFRNQGEKLAFVVNGRVLSVAPLKDGAVIERDAIIDGKFETAYVRDLVAKINLGSMPVPLTEIK